MAKVTVNTEEAVYSINKWLGLNEAPDGDNKLKPGEASEMVNFRVTRDGALKDRDSLSARKLTAAAVDAGTPGAWSPIMDVYAVWHGVVGGTERTVVAATADLEPNQQGRHNVYAYEILKVDDNSYEAINIMPMYSDLSGRSRLAYSDAVCIVPFEGKLYFYGDTFGEWDGTYPTLTTPVSGGVTSSNFYVPVTVIGVPVRSTAEDTTSGGTTLEQINLITSNRRIFVTGDGTGKYVILPELGLHSIVSIVNRVTGAALSSETDFSVTRVSTPAGRYVTQIEFTAAPANGDNVLEITYRAAGSNPNSLRLQGMRFAELYNGTQNNRVFLYGNGSNVTFYSGIDYDGKPNALYFPELNFLEIGDADTPITGMIRHFSRLIVFKRDSAYSVQYGQITLADGGITAAFYTTPTNRQIGSEAPGMVQLIENNPVTLFDGHAYLWRNTSSYSSNLSIDERQAKRISDRVWKTLSGFDFANTFMYDDNPESELYIICGKTAVIYNYALDVWYTYRYADLADGRSVRGMWRDSNGQLWIFAQLSYANAPQLFITTRTTGWDYTWRPDTGLGMTYWKDIVWTSGAISFDRPWQRKFSARLFITDYPAQTSDYYVSLATDRSPEGGAEKHIEHTESGEAAQIPKVTRLKLKAKKFAHYRLKIYKQGGRVTILGVNIKVRYGGDVK